MCIFCQIIAGDTPAYKIRETDKALAFLDIKPVHPGHILVIPKQHAATVEDLSAADFQAVTDLVQAMGGAIKNKLGYQGYNIMLNNGPVAGQEVPHLHFHVIPRVEGDQFKHWPGKEYGPDEAALIKDRLIN